MRLHTAWLRCFSLAVLCLLGHATATGPSWRVTKKEEVREVSLSVLITAISLIP